MHRFREPETQWDQHRPAGQPRPREGRLPDMEVKPRPLSNKHAADGLRHTLQQTLRQDINLRGYGLEGNVINGIARVQGVVDTLAEKLYIRELVSAIPGISGYEDGVSISTDGAITDGQVEMEIGEELDRDPVLGPNVGVQVRDGIAYLLGRVTSREVESEVMRLASRARGVVSVVSQLQVDPRLESP
ncbi:MAG: BON domain-containing protein [Firmicutes bacterium]|nr:BON domain-containing protein [Bacillota bacterium]